MQHRITTWCLTLLGIGAMTLPAAAGIVMYVDDDADFGGDGSSWATAHRWLSTALQSAGAGTEIRVAQGRYRPDEEESDRVMTFQLVNGVTVLGGFAGIGADDPDERDPAAFETVLTGDLDLNDGPDFANYEDNSLHVVTGSFTNSTAVLDGVTITAGHADGPAFPQTGSLGAGMLIETGTPTIRNVRFVANLAFEGGAGLVNIFSSPPNLTDCVFEGNSTNLEVGAGGGMIGLGNTGGTLTRCVFRNNRAVFAGGFGGQLTSPTLNECVFEGNIATAGGGIGMFDGGATINNTRFARNAATVGGGAAMIDIAGGANAIFVNCAFEENTAGFGGGAYNEAANTTYINGTFAGNELTPPGPGGAVGSVSEASPLLRNTVVWGNGVDPVADMTGASTSLKFCLIEGGWSGVGANNIDADPLFFDSAGGDYRLGAGSPAIDRGDNSGYPSDLPLDAGGQPRYDNDPCVEDTGGSDGVNFPIDLGAYEHQVACPSDLDCNGAVDFGDVIEALRHWGSCPTCAEDIDGNGAVDFSDIEAILSAWGPCA